MTVADRRQGGRLLGLVRDAFGVALPAASAVVLAACASGAALTGGAPTGGTPPSAIATSAVPPAPAGPRLVALPGARVDTDTIIAATRSPAAPRPTLASLAVASAAPRQARSGRSDAAVAGDAFEVVPILWATDRRATREESSGHGPGYQPVAFGPERGETLSRGIARITIPKAKRAFGAIPRPREVTLLSVNLYRQAEDPRMHFTVGEVTRLSDEAFRTAARELLAGAAGFKGQCFLYVHGYRNTFDDALFRAAQMTADMGFDGLTLVYSWPSKGRLDGYLADRDSVDVSQPHFRRYLEDLEATSGCERVHIVAHSLGARLVVDTFFPASGGSGQRAFGRIGQIVLASPDIDAGILKSRAAAIGETARSVTLYANGHDEALKWSRRFAGGYTRAGDLVAGEPVVVAGIDTIDLTPMSKATWVFVGANHNAYAEGRHVLHDIAMLMQRGVRPPDRRFAVYRPVAGAAGTFWRYVAN
ncbi:MAG: alpha/beta hydrolase [Hyphomicrobiaceae bacterium]